MSPRRSSATASNRFQGPSHGVRKNRGAKLPKNLRLRQARSPATPAALSSREQAPLKPSTPSQEPNAGPQTRAQKRKLTDEGKTPQMRKQKRPRRDPASALTASTESQELISITQPTVPQQGNKLLRSSKDEPSNKRLRPSTTQAPLSTENLEKLQSELDNSEEMQPAAMPSHETRKTAPSQHISFTESNGAASTRSQRSAESLKSYRFSTLESARLYVRPEYPPVEIRGLLNDIFTREIPEGRRLEISSIASKNAEIFSKTTQGASREDDCVEALYHTFYEQFPAQKFNCPRKADWDPSLKPNVQPDWDLGALHRANDGTGNVVDRPSKRQRVDPSLLSPDASQPASQPRAVPPHTRQVGAVKSPRPDFTVGHHHSTITNALVERGLGGIMAYDFPRVLQSQRELLSDPTVDFLDVRFPIQTFEGKAYATGKTAFEAENQAAVSGACMVNIQQQLFNLHKNVYPNSSKESRTAFAFSACMEGPVIQFWVHYSLLKEGTRLHYMNLLHVCNGALHDTLEALLVKWEQLMTWYEDEFLKEVADRLYDLAKLVAPP